MAMGPQPFIADGFADDCDELIHRCLKETPVTYSAFTKVFRSMQMSCVFHERQSGAEIAELSEELITIAKYYMMANTSNYEASVVGLFLVYALVKLQPFENFAYLRIAEDDVQYIERIELVARREKRLDVLYTLGSVLAEHTRYTAAARERGMEPSFRKYLENFPSLNNLGHRPKGVFLRQNEELDIIKELSAVQLKYDSAKVAANVPELNYVDSKFASDLNSSLKNIVSGLIETETAPNSEEDEPVQETARNIKDRAMKIKVNPMRHLVGIQDRSPTRKTTPHVSDIKTSPGKIKTVSPIKTVTSKKRIVIGKRKSQKRKRLSSSSSMDDDSDMSLEQSDNNSSDIDLAKFNKPQSISKSKPKNNDENLVEIEIGSQDLNLGNLPCLITSENNGLSYEIEIIDQREESTNDTKQEVNEDKSEESTKNRAKAAFKSEQEIILARKDRKDLKKPILQSRFKRMGMEPIANFKTKK